MNTAHIVKYQMDDTRDTIMAVFSNKEDADHYIEEMQDESESYWSETWLVDYWVKNNLRFPLVFS